MVRGKDPAIRLGLSIVGILLCAAPVGMRAQGRFEASFRILENGAAIGSATVAVARDEEGWHVPVPSYQSEDLHKAVPGSRLILVEEGGHYSYRRHWQDWNRMVDAFVKETEGSV